MSEHMVYSNLKFSGCFEFCDTNCVVSVVAGLAGNLQNESVSLPVPKEVWVRTRDTGSQTCSLKKERPRSEERHPGSHTFCREGKEKWLLTVTVCDAITADKAECGLAITLPTLCEYGPRGVEAGTTRFSRIAFKRKALVSLLPLAGFPSRKKASPDIAAPFCQIIKSTAAKVVQCMYAKEMVWLLRRLRLSHWSQVSHKSHPHLLPLGWLLLTLLYLLK